MIKVIFSLMGVSVFFILPNSLTFKKVPKSHLVRNHEELVSFGPVAA
jgi:hypothetical protein